MSRAALLRAIEIAGSQTILAKGIGVTQGHIWFWLERSKKGIPAEYCAKVEELTAVRAFELRPDIFSPPEPLAPTDDKDGSAATSGHGNSDAAAYPAAKRGAA